MALTNRDVTAYGRLSYPDLFVPRQAFEDSDKKSYALTLLIPKSDTATIARVQAAIQAAVQDGVERRVLKNAIDPAQTKNPPLRDGDSMNNNGEPRGPEFAGHWFIAAKSPESRKPFVVDQNVQPIINEADIYAGCYVNAAFQFYAYNHKSGGVGIAASFSGVQKAKDGEPLGGPAIEATDVFSALGGAPAAAQGGFGQPQQQGGYNQPPAQTDMGF
ncbi:DUF2815 family protein [Corynebacterium glutamicum]|uniref:DUF2815 family protein n=1 Tax=Corynebacterium glutamicum TaxID=1718 RepID=UPI001B8BB1AD|nr:DUF2815 family protein [Corynebacterium glutamicum]